MSESKDQEFSDGGDPKAKFREALEKKKVGGVQDKIFERNSKISGGQTSGNTRKIFRRKSGSS